jgi:alpha-tubulin suppressor-like RCC1 family protein
MLRAPLVPALLLLALVACDPPGPRGYGTRPPGPGPTTGGGTTGKPTGGPPTRPADVGPAVEIAAGGLHTCVRRQAGTVQCWGRGVSGELGDGNGRDVPGPPVDVLGIVDAEQLALGAMHSCARLRSGAVQCWGSNVVGQLGDGAGGPGQQSARPVAVQGLADAVEIRAGAAHTCAVRRAGGVVCWGDNRQAQVGVEGRQAYTVPVAVPGLADAVEVVGGSTHTCARTRSGGVLCWGTGTQGQLGDGSQRRTTPTAVPGLADATGLAAGQGHTCALRRGGAASCWGAGFARAPAPVKGVAGAVEISAGEDHTCARSKGALVCWGRNDRGQLGDGSTADQVAAAPVRGLAEVRGFAAGARHTCALTRAGGALCWGSNDAGALGAGLLPGGADDGSPSVVRNVADATDLASGDGFSCAVNGGAVVCWGAGTLGQLGDGSPGDRPSALPVPGISDAVQVVAGLSHACARRSSGQVACWGHGGSGQLGDGAKVGRPTPVAVSGFADAVQLAAGDEHTCAVRKAGAVACWGKGGTGQLGQGKQEDSARPVSVAGNLAGVTQLALGAGHSCALTSARKVLCWGSNSYGQIGSGHTVGFDFLLAPTGVVKLDDAVELSAGDFHNCARRSTGAVACWGRGHQGQLGANITSDWSTRVPVSGLGGATAVSAGRAYTCAATGAAVMCWGSNAAGQFGDGGRGGAKTPVAGPRIGDVVRLAAGTDHTCALRSGGRIQCWGSNQRGQLGDGATRQAPAPLAVLGLP